MNTILHILINNILPLFLLIFLGFLLDRKFTLDINSLTKVNFYLFVPSFTFVNLYQTDIPISAYKAMLVAALIMIANSLISHLVARLRRYDPTMKIAFQNAIMFYNSGNIGIPVITLVFSSGAFLVGERAPYLSLALTTQIMVLVVQNSVQNTFGFYNAGRSRMHWTKAIMIVFRMPAIYMVILAFVLKAFPFDFTLTPFWPVLEYSRSALVAIALTALGVQLSKCKIQLKNRTVYLAVFIRLLIGPALALLFIWLLRIDGIVAQVLMISSAVPTAVNTALIAVEYNNHPDFSTQVVIVSTLASSMTLTGVIYIASILFPV